MKVSLCSITLIFRYSYPFRDTMWLWIHPYALKSKPSSSTHYFLDISRCTWCWICCFYCYSNLSACSCLKVFPGSQPLTCGDDDISIGENENPGISGLFSAFATSDITLQSALNVLIHICKSAVRDFQLHSQTLNHPQLLFFMFSPCSRNLLWHRFELQCYSPAYLNWQCTQAAKFTQFTSFHSNCKVLLEHESSP